MVEGTVIKHKEHYSVSHISDTLSVGTIDHKKRNKQNVCMLVCPSIRPPSTSWLDWCSERWIKQYSPWKKKKEGEKERRKEEGKRKKPNLTHWLRVRTMRNEDNLQNQKHTWKDKMQSLVTPKCQEKRLSLIRNEKWRKVLSPNRIFSWYREKMAPFQIQKLRFYRWWVRLEPWI